MQEFILAENDGGKSFKRTFIIYLVNYFFSKPKNRYCNAANPKARSVIIFFKSWDKTDRVFPEN